MANKSNSILSIKGGVRAARVLVGLAGHRASGKNSCVANAMKGMKFTAQPGQGGRRNKWVHYALAKKYKDCGGDVDQKKLDDMIQAALQQGNTRPAGI